MAPLSAAAASPDVLAQPHDRVPQTIDAASTVTLTGNVHPVATGTPARTASGLPMEHMSLTLQADAAQEASLEQLIAAQRDPKSPLYGHFLTPEQFGAQFGASQNDIQKITSWLTSYGFSIDEVTAGRRSIVFSGTSDQVQAAFKTEIAAFPVAGSVYYANKQDPQIPAAFAGVVRGVVRLHNVQHRANSHNLRPVAASTEHPDFTSGSSHYLSPADYATIYDISSLYNSGINGSGQSIAIVARSNISVTDVEQFRQSFGLPANDPSIVIVNSDPGKVSGDMDETTLDTEWSGAIAPRAKVKVIVAASTNTADGIDLSAQYAVNNQVAQIVSLSYGSCEAYMGSGGTAFYNSLWKQAAAQGMTVVVAAGDSGAAGCDWGGNTTGSIRAVNGLCSSPFSTCVGGTEFADTKNPGQYWLPGNNAQYGSALSY
ncbi:MAG: peptidase S53, partial [Acidobacteriaceae bacterium]|nr:peptidase S53 [Acidobacteriaceae bacterium]